ncbi:unnamed protein product [Schistosoma margrebowiei]|uniref:Uncharacterized protein n=1 Tax=Schistosoma margrebowiei TaxID=48269 RepID=A0A183MWD6_9TREM|nr:unnamed protein product [Schistosoma margrebowiei]
MKTSTSEEKYGIQWTAQNQLDDFNFADDLALLSHIHEQMQIKADSVAAFSASVGLNIRKGKSKILKCNTENTNTITFDGETNIKVRISNTNIKTVLLYGAESWRTTTAIIGKIPWNNQQMIDHKPNKSISCKRMDELSKYAKAI